MTRWRRVLARLSGPTGERSVSHVIASLVVSVSLPLVILVAVATERFISSERDRLEVVAARAGREVVSRLESEVLQRLNTLRTLAATVQRGPEPIEMLKETVGRFSPARPIDFIISDPSGRTLADTRPTRIEDGPVPAYLLSLPSFDGDHHISDLLEVDGGDSSFVLVSVSLRLDGRLLGMLSSPIATDQLKRILDETLAGGLVGTLILDRRGRTIAISGGGLAKDDRATVNRLSAQIEQTGETGPDDLADSFADRRLEVLSGWRVLTLVPQEVLLAPLWQSLVALGGVALFLLALAAAGSAKVSRQLIGAHRGLADAAARLGMGAVVTAPDLAIREARRVGEAMATASCSIAIQADALRLANTELENRVARRTADLFSKSAQLEAVLETMSQGLLVIIDGRLALCNANAKRMLGLPEHLARPGTPFRDLTAFTGAAGEAPSGQEGGPAPAPFECRGASGEVLEVLTAEMPGRDGFVRTFTDISTRKQHEREIEAAREEADRANRAKGDFMANMSHEMRTPLNSVLGYAEILSRTLEAGSPSQRFAQHIQTEGESLRVLVEAMFDLDKIDAGIVELDLRPFDPRELVAVTIDAVRPMADAKGLVLSSHEEPYLPASLLGDEERIRQVLLNLVVNAVKFTPEGSVDVRLAARDGGAGMVRLRLEVADTGIGIDRADQSLIFERFYQAEAGRARRFGGGGLGLAIGQKIVAMMGGELGVTSAPGVGSTFWVELPLRRPPPQPAADRAPARILVVDDGIANRELARALLREAGHVVTLAGTGETAVRLAGACRFDAILMDVAMPEMDGLTAMRIIRESGQASATSPVIVCTANATSDQLDQFRAAGAAECLVKPFTRGELMAALDRQLTGAVQPARPTPAGAEGTLPATLADLIGPEAVAAAAAEVRSELEALLDIEPDETDARRRLRLGAHSAISTLGLLGLQDLAAACRALEDASRDTLEIEEPLSGLRTALTAASARLDAMTRPLPSPPLSVTVD